ncbi:MAG: universal stress protein [Pseudonocardiaceae bacterium]
MTSESADPALIVVGVDGSKQSKDALRWAVRHGQQVNGTVRAVAAWHHPVQFGYPRVFPDREFEQQARGWLEDAVTEVTTAFPGCEVDPRVERGHPPRVLLDHAAEADLLVLGNKGRGAFGGMMIGSVALQCVHHASCPVVIVR